MATYKMGQSPEIGKITAMNLSVNIELSEEQIEKINKGNDIILTTTFLDAPQYSIWIAIKKQEEG